MRANTHGDCGKSLRTQSMSEKDPELEKALNELASGISSILRCQEELAGKMDALEARIHHIEEGGHAAPSIERDKEDDYDYRVLLNARTYTIEDVEGKNAHMESVRRCLALRDLSQLRTRYHTGSGDRDVTYSYRLVDEGRAGESGWTPLEYHIEEGAGADFSARLPLAETIRDGASFELRQQLSLRGAFTTRNEWVTLLVEYPTEEFWLEVLVPSGRHIVGARREESQGASNSFNKRRVYPRMLNETGQTRLEWKENQPVTGRAYTLFWDW